MARTNAILLGAVLACSGAVASSADTGVVVGDSLGVGVSMASHLRSFAKNSVSIRATTGATDQIERAPEGSTVFLSLGTNDAVGNIDNLSAGIERVVAAAKKAKVRLVWMGPPCVFKPWNKNAETLDAELKTALSGTGVTYVSMHDPRLCDRSVRAKDGVHFSMTGYHVMWDKARNAAGFTATAGETAAAATPGEETSRAPGTPAKKAKKTSRSSKGTKKRVKRRRKTVTAAATARATESAAPAEPAAPAVPSNPQ